MNDLLTVKEVQDILSVDRTTVYRMLKDGRFPPQSKNPQISQISADWQLVAVRNLRSSAD